jgi:hypothetical protein
MTWLIDSATGTLTLPTWIGGAMVLAFLVFGVVALRPARVRAAGVLAVALVVLGIVSVSGLLERADRAAERRALETRTADLAARGLAPGSALACLDDSAGETVEGACEKAVFARPEAAAAAVSYIAARLDLLAAGTRYAAHGGSDYAAPLTGLRRSLELDRFGLVAHVLSRRDGCTVEACGAFALLQDTGAVKANLQAHAYDKYVERHAPDWSAPASENPPVAQAAPPAEKPAEASTPVAAATPEQPAPHKLTVPFDYPSSKSIPPVSIMNAEPPLPATAGAGGEAGQAKAQAAAPAPKKGGQAQAPAATTR